MIANNTIVRITTSNGGETIRRLAADYYPTYDVTFFVGYRKAATIGATRITSVTAITDSELTTAIEADAYHWARHFEVTDMERIEARRTLQRANVAVNFFEPLIPYLPTDYPGDRSLTC